MNSLHQYRFDSMPLVGQNPFRAVAFYVVLVVLVLLAGVSLRGQEISSAPLASAKDYPAAVKQHIITRQYADEMMERWKSFGSALAPNPSSAGVLPKESIQYLLDQPNAIGIRFQLGLDAAGQFQAVLAAQNTDNSLILYPESEPPHGILMPRQNQTTRDFSAQNILTRSYARALVGKYGESKWFGRFKNKYGGWIGKEAIQTLLKQNGVAGVKFFFGLNASNEPQLVYVPVTADGKELWDATLLDFGKACPPACEPEPGF